MKRLKNTSAVLLTLFTLLICQTLHARQSVNLDAALKENTIHFSLGPRHELEGTVRDKLRQELSQNQFVGLAELHGSEQLSYFTTGLIDLLKEEGFGHFALEMGPFQANALSQLSKKSEGLSESIRQANQTYGSKLLRITPLIFANHKEDALFLQKAADASLRLWGLDQEHTFSYEMHFDKLYKNVASPSSELTALYKESKETIRKWNRKEVLKGKFKMGCELLWSENIDKFLNLVSVGKEAKARVAAMRTSWNIYCELENNRPSNQKRADYMKANFDSLLTVAAATSEKPRVFLKFGSVHLTRGKSPYGVNDIGQHVKEIADQNNSGFLTIRHMKRYRNGKDLIGKNGWKESTSFMKQGKKDQWTLIDLRPVRALLAEGKLTCTKREAFEIYSYDLMLISPNDHKAKQNF
ncbi:MAG: hypothetical protein HEP71_00020 [Roseivirga sp.]|nr:hypothetical protein [Roseivirga sp.]